MANDEYPVSIQHNESLDYVVHPGEADLTSGRYTSITWKNETGATGKGISRGEPFRVTIPPPLVVEGQSGEVVIEVDDTGNLPINLSHPGVYRYKCKGVISNKPAHGFSDPRIRT